MVRSPPARPVASWRRWPAVPPVLTGAPRTAGSYAGLVAAAGTVLAVWLVVQHPFAPERSALLAVLLSCTVIAELRPVKAPFGRYGIEITASTPFALATLILSGPSWAATGLVLGALLSCAINRRRWWLVAFTAGQYVLATAAAGGVFARIVDGRVLSDPLLFRQTWEMVATLAAATTFLVVHGLMTGGLLALLHRERLLPTWRDTFGQQGPAHAALLAFGPVTVVIGQVSIGLLPLLLVPLAVAYRSAALTLEKEHQSLHDGLTGLPNRSLFHQRCAEAVQHGEPAALLLVDLDRFKDVNDTLGHHVGDQVLRHLGPRLAALIDTPHTVARLGGDEFGIVLRDVRPEEAIAVAQRVAEVLCQPIDLELVNLAVGASVGIALFPGHASEADLLIQRADIAMYAAKEQGRDVVVYASELDHTSPLRLTLVSELRHAIAEGQLVLHYQPKVAVATGAIEGVEALVRWEHPTRGLIPPDEFIPVAEQTGLVRPLTEFVLDAALAQGQRWQEAGFPVAVAVNVSARVLHDVELPSLVARLMRTHHVDRAKLVVEITESSIMVDPVRAREALEELRSLGVEIALDDYGTGHSSLAHLKRLPISEIKIDKSFITNMTEDSSDAVITASTIDLARRLGLRVVAEGVESEATWHQLRALGCDLAQGFLFSRALAADTLTAWMEEHDRDGRRSHAPVVGRADHAGTAPLDRAHDAARSEGAERLAVSDTYAGLVELLRRTTS